mmetsp:Transcript_21772/g.32408  ORF Transcript_21772/g.32408 Transcript_21772/m.32408 type:complete len:195 (+) Transcript_21772:29-613(+)
MWGKVVPNPKSLQLADEFRTMVALAFMLATVQLFLGWRSSIANLIMAAMGFYAVYDRNNYYPATILIYCIFICLQLYSHLSEIYDLFAFGAASGETNDLPRNRLLPAPYIERIRSLKGLSLRTHEAATLQMVSFYAILITFGYRLYRSLTEQGHQARARPELDDDIAEMPLRGMDPAPRAQANPPTMPAGAPSS